MLVKAMNNKFLQMLGFAQKAGVISSGTETVRDYIKKGKAKLVIGAEDFSERTWKDVESSCRYYNVKCYRLGTKLELGTAIGKSPRGLIAVNDEKIASVLLDLLPS